MLRLPDKFRCSNRTSAGKEEAFCMLLRGFAYLCRYVDLMPQFGRSLPEISLITNAVIDYIYDTHGHLLTTLNHPWMAREIGTASGCVWRTSSEFDIK